MALVETACESSATPTTKIPTSINSIKFRRLTLIKITGIKTFDLRFPPDYLDGSDAMNPDPDYSAAYIILVTDAGLEGHGLTLQLGVEMNYAYLHLKL